MNESLSFTLKTLRLSGLAETLDDRLQEAGRNHLTHAEFLFEIVMRRYETRSTMMTSNRPLEEGGKLLGDVPTATAILDRFLHHEIFSFGGKSYRLGNRRSDSKPATGDKVPTGSRKSKKNSKPAKAPTGSSAEEN
jgi:hypothetical protein